jgi:hypothetical protein
MNEKPAGRRRILHLGGDRAVACGHGHPCCPGLKAWLHRPRDAALPRPGEASRLTDGASYDEPCFCAIAPPVSSGGLFGAFPLPPRGLPQSGAHSREIKTLGAMIPFTLPGGRRILRDAPCTRCADGQGGEPRGEETPIWKARLRSAPCTIVPRHQHIVGIAVCRICGATL